MRIELTAITLPSVVFGWGKVFEIRGGHDIASN
jgi:hypothetical protein